MFSPQQHGYSYQNYDQEKVRSWAIALGDSIQRDDVREFARRLIHELCEPGAPQMTNRTFRQLARWCKTGGTYEEGMPYAQKISSAVFGQIIQRTD
jgi:restriction endonuclease Mrr